MHQTYVHAQIDAERSQKTSLFVQVLIYFDA
jgi:hypothetical protein